MMASRSRDFNQRRPRRAERSRILVVSEGEVTEIQYLEGLVQFLRNSGATVRGVRAKGVGRDPARVLQTALDIASSDPDGFDEIWVLVDVDSHTSLPDALQRAGKTRIPMVVSNPCFEIWLLWHYEDCTAHLSATELERKLAKHGHDGKKIPVRFPYRSHLEAAVRASKRQVTHTSKGDNPSTAMPDLLAALQRRP